MSETTMKLSYNDFKNEVKENIPHYFKTQEYRVIFDKAEKNNVTYDTISFVSGTMGPCVYLQKEYENFIQSGIVFSGYMASLAARVNNSFKSASKIQGTVNSVLQFDLIRTKIYPRIVRKSGNEDFLNNKVYEEVADLAVLYFVSVKLANRDSGIITIPKTLFDSWNIDIQTLHDTAFSNLEKDHLFICPISDLLPMMGEMGEISDPVDMYVVSNSTKNYGAACMLSSKVMEELKEKLGSFYIIPSSIHEFIAIPTVRDQENVDVSEIVEMIRDVNASSVPDEDILSDSLYGYDFENHTLYVVA
jgi:hypothetical protein